MLQVDDGVLERATKKEEAAVKAMLAALLLQGDVEVRCFELNKDGQNVDEKMSPVDNEKMRVWPESLMG